MTVAPSQKNNNDVFNIKYLAASVGALMAISAPFMAIGGYKVKTDLRILNLELSSQAQAAEISSHEKSDVQDRIDLAGSLGSINESLKSINSRFDHLETSQKNIWQAISKTGREG